jgi:hypothetical protein
MEQPDTPRSSSVGGFHPKGAASAPGAPFCHRHAEERAFAHCAQCLTGLCRACVVLDPDGTFCRTCMASRRATTRATAAQALWLLVMVAVGLALLLPRLPRFADAGERAAVRTAVVAQREEARHLVDGVDYGARAYEAGVLFRGLQKNRCDVASAAALADIQGAAGQLDAAERTLTLVQGCEGSDDDAFLQLSRARVEHARGHAEQALVTLASAVDADPTEVKLLTQQVEWLAAAGRRAEALAVVMRWLDVSPRNVSAWDWRARLTPEAEDVCAALDTEMGRNLAGLATQRSLMALAELRRGAGCPLLSARTAWPTGAGGTLVFTARVRSEDLRFLVSPQLTRTVVSRRAVRLLRAPPPGADAPMVWADLLDGDGPRPLLEVDVTLPAAQWTSGEARHPSTWPAVPAPVRVAHPEDAEPADLEHVDVLLGQDVLGRLPFAWTGDALVVGTARP